MKKILILAMLLAFTPTVNSAESKVLGIYFFDITLYRPAGIVATIAGSAIFVSILPLTAIAAISPPNDAFDKTVNALVLTPFNYTFNRPLGVIDADADGVYRE
ncbi:MAG: hypothetical protein ABSB19_05625 [Methylomonas sp.]